MFKYVLPGFHWNIILITLSDFVSCHVKQITFVYKMNLCDISIFIKRMYTHTHPFIQNTIIQCEYILYISIFLKVVVIMAEIINLS